MPDSAQPLSPRGPRERGIARLWCPTGNMKLSSREPRLKVIEGGWCRIYRISILRPFGFMQYKKMLAMSQHCGP